jgi:dihydroorotase
MCERVYPTDKPGLLEGKETLMTMQRKASFFDAATQPDIGVSILSRLSQEDIRVFNSPEYAVFPGFCDVHVHFREPGFSYKETMKSGCLAAARGGYTAVCTMPNLNPVPDSVEHLRMQTELIESDAAIHVYPYGSITVEEKGETLADLEGMAPNAIAFSDDGRGVQNDDMMRCAMLRAKPLGKMIVAHCEVNSLLRGG